MVGAQNAVQGNDGSVPVGRLDDAGASANHRRSERSQHDHRDGTRRVSRWGRGGGRRCRNHSRIGQTRPFPGSPPFSAGPVPIRFSRTSSIAASPSRPFRVRRKAIVGEKGKLATVPRTSGAVSWNIFAPALLIRKLGLVSAALSAAAGLLHRRRADGRQNQGAGGHASGEA